VCGNFNHEIHEMGGMLVCVEASRERELTGVVLVVCVFLPRRTQRDTEKRKGLGVWGLSTTNDTNDTNGWDVGVC
jgi:hypothetical protein